MTVPKRLLPISVLVFIFLSCSGDKSPELESPSPLTIRWAYSSADVKGASQQTFIDEAWDIYFFGSPDSIKLMNASPVFRWTRIHFQGTPSSSRISRNPYLEFEAADSALVFFTTYPAGTPVNKYISWYQQEGRFSLNLDSLLSANPSVKLLVIENRNQPAAAPDKEIEIIEADGNPVQIIADEQNRRLVRTIQRMDSLWIQNRIGEFEQFIHGGYSDNGVSKADKMNFYKFAALRVEGMHFDYGNFAFFDLPDGRKRMIYGYNLWKGDTLIDAGTEDRYFKLTNGIWKETGNLSRFYKSVADAKIMGGERDNYLYLPPGYYEFPSRRYPVIYVFNDFRDRNTDWIAYRIPTVLDSAITRQYIKPAIVIFLDGGPSLYMKSAHADAYNFEDYFMTMIGPNTDVTLRTLANRENRFLTGFGQGGLAALYYMCKYPTFFSSAAAINGRFTQSILADHVDAGNPEYWNEKYPTYFLGMMPDYILEKLHFILLQETGGSQEDDFLDLSLLLREKKASVETMTFSDVWQENLPLIISRAFGGHMNRKETR